jgi:nitrite reductase/ring-hydroxylating ferredoxin subunit
VEGTSAGNAFLVCDLDELEDPGTRGFSLSAGDNTTLEGFVVRQGEAVYAYIDSCPHTGAPLAWVPNRYLDLEGRYIECALHGALFTLERGYCVRGPCAGRSLTPLGVEVSAGRVLVRPPAR